MSDESVNRVLQEAFLKSDDESLSHLAAEEITYAFASLRATGADYIGDERKLPYPKEVIRQAFRKQISFLKKRCCEEPGNPEWRIDLQLHERVAFELFDFQAIDPEDEAAVCAANEWDKHLRLGYSELGTDKEKQEYLKHAIECDQQTFRDRFALLLKYRERATKEMELFVNESART